jgi:hypothetical protein
MGAVRRLTPRPGVPELGAAVEQFLATIGNRNTARAYAIALRALAVDAPLSALDGEAGWSGSTVPGDVVAGPSRRACPAAASNRSRAPSTPAAWAKARRRCQRPTSALNRPKVRSQTVRPDLWSMSALGPQPHDQASCPMKIALRD